MYGRNNICETRQNVAVWLQNYEDPREQQEVQQKAQVVVDCVAELALRRGLSDMEAMLGQNVELWRSPEGTWRLRGTMPHGMEGGKSLLLLLPFLECTCLVVTVEGNMVWDVKLGAKPYLTFVMSSGR